MCISKAAHCHEALIGGNGSGTLSQIMQIRASVRWTVRRTLKISLAAAFCTDWSRLSCVAGSLYNMAFSYHLVTFCHLWRDKSILYGVCELLWNDSRLVYSCSYQKLVNAFYSKYCAVQILPVGCSHNSSHSWVPPLHRIMGEAIAL